jgi:hypothetical protein
MLAQITGTVIDGGLELDQPVKLPNNTRVSVTVKAVAPAVPAAQTEAGWSAWKRRITERPVHAAGLHFSRDELHERR